MRQMYQCEKCGRIFADYDECSKHESMHWGVCDGWYRRFDKASAEFIQYSDKQEAPSYVGVELTRWNFETGEEERTVALYHLKEVVPADKLVSDEERQRQEGAEEA